MSTTLQLLATRSAIKGLIEKMTDPVEARQFTEFVKENDDLEQLLELKAIIERQLAAPNEEFKGKSDYETHFPNQKAAEIYLEEVIFPVITAKFRLFKPEGGKQDEFIVVNRDWIKGNDRFQIYSKSADVVDRLASEGVPVNIFFTKPGDKKDTIVKIDVLTEWKRTEAVQDLRLNGHDYVPGGPAIVNSTFNTYKDVSVEAVEGVDISGFLYHLEHNLCNGRKEYFDYMIKWLAHMIQKPMERPMTGVAFIGEEGNGKGIFIDMMQKVLGGDRNANTTPSAEDTKKFNTTVGGKLFLVFDEATFAGDHAQSDFMKKLVTEPKVRIEGKGRDAYSVNNYARTLITSNNMESAVPATIGARRWLIVETKNRLPQTDLRTMANSFGLNGRTDNVIADFAGGVKHFLETLDLTDFNPQTLPQQDTGMETKIRNTYKTDPIFAFLCEWVRSPQLEMHRAHSERDQDGMHYGEEVLAWEDEIRFSDFALAFKAACQDQKASGAAHNTISGKLKDYGITARTGTGNVRFLTLPAPTVVLDNLRKKSRWDQIVSGDQELYINGYMSMSMKKSLKVVK